MPRRADDERVPVEVDDEVASVSEATDQVREVGRLDSTPVDRSAPVRVGRYRSVKEDADRHRRRGTRGLEGMALWHRRVGRARGTNADIW